MKTGGLFKEYAGELTVISRALDVLAVLAAGVAAYALNVAHWPMPAQYRVALLMGCLLVLVIFPHFRTYRSFRGAYLLREFHDLTLAWFAVMSAMIVVGFMTNTAGELSRFWIGEWAILGWSLLVLFRITLRIALRIMRSQGWNQRRIVVLGAGKLGQEIVKRVKLAGWMGFDIVAFLDDNQQLHHETIEGVEVRGDLSKLDSLLEDCSIDEVWLALPLRAERRIKEALFAIRHHTAAVRLIPDIYGFHHLNHSVTEVAGIPLLNLRISPIMGINSLLKAMEDRILAALILLLISPLFLVIVIGVKLSSPGPIIFRQKRHGRNGQPVVVYKFRTMVVHEEQTGRVSQARKDDPRVTRFGAFLRRTSLDELPQFINVLQGRLSVVGPRPHAIAHNEQYKDRIGAYMQRHQVKPGITGWAQVNGWRGETDTLEKMEKRVEHDLYYIEHWSLWFDLKIVLLTLIKGFGGKNAY